MAQSWKEGLREASGTSLPGGAQRVEYKDARVSEVERAARDCFLRLNACWYITDARRCEELFMQAVDGFRDFLSDEEKGDDVAVARVLREKAGAFVYDHGTERGRALFVRFLKESAIAMNGIERHELKRFLHDFYFANEREEPSFISRKEREELARTLRDGIVLADELHVDDPDYKEDPHFLQSFETTLDTIRFNEEADQIYALLQNSSLISESDHVRIREILARQRDSRERGMLLACGFKFYKPDSRFSVKEQEVLRLEHEGLSFNHENLLEENLIIAIRALCIQGEIHSWDRFSFQNFFPCEEHVSPEISIQAFSQAVEFIGMDFEGTRLRLEKIHKGMGAYVELYIFSMFGRLQAFMRDFLQYVPRAEADRLWASFEDVLCERGGEYYVHWQEKEALKKAKASRVPLQPLAPVVPVAPERDAGLAVHVQPLVIKPVLHASFGSHDFKQKEEVFSSEAVLARIAAGQLLHLVEEIRTHPKRFADALRDHDVRSAAWRALERAMSRGLFGVVERAAPVFFGKGWKMEDPSLRSLARKYFVQELVAERRGDVGHRLPEAILTQKAFGFGFDWDELVEEAEAQLPKKMKKRKGSS